MSAMHKVKFAVLESSLLARKGNARPAMSASPQLEEVVSRADAEPHVELVAADDYRVDLAALITRPGRLAMVRLAEFEAAPVTSPITAPPAAAEAESVVDTVKAWTRKMTKDRRLAMNFHPRGLNRDQAARYVGLSMTTFNRFVVEGLLPGPLHFGRRRVWDRRALDEALDRMSGLDAIRAPAA
ncbi:MAG: hypothetical protein WD673_15005 [Alphaproteobacteria bacterium]